MAYKLLIINPGSTSTKIGVYSGEKEVLVETLRHSAEEIGKYDTIFDQKGFRKEVIMKVLKERILKEGRCYPGGILKVDKFINHQMDPNLMKDIAVEFIRRFASSNVNKILTIEASGIAPAIMMGFLLNLPVVFAKKKKPNTMENMLSTTVSSFTKQRQYNVIISREYLNENDRVLFIDDFLAYGNAAKGIMELVEQSGAELVGMGFIIEKAFQDGGRYLREKGIHVESLAIIESLDNCQIKLKEE